MVKTDPTARIAYFRAVRAAEDAGEGINLYTSADIDELLNLLTAQQEALEAECAKHDEEAYNDAIAALETLRHERDEARAEAELARSAYRKLDGYAEWTQLRARAKTAEAELEALRRERDEAQEKLAKDESAYRGLLLTSQELAGQAIADRARAEASERERDKAREDLRLAEERVEELIEELAELNMRHYDH